MSLLKKVKKMVVTKEDVSRLIPETPGFKEPRSKINYKFNEDKNLHLLKDHIDSTYDAHYSKEKFQATEFIVDSGHGTGFCMGNILKYAQRYGKKGSKDEARKDLFKILHYAVIQLHIHDMK